MSNTKDTLKISGYDKFKCTADKCKFTCCEGWDISIDNDTYHKWQKINGKYIIDKAKLKKCGVGKQYIINKETHETCPLLDKQGLCQIVKDYGEEYLSLTCHTFPRVENSFDGKKELTLSCACPEVVETISKLNGKVKVTSENNIDIFSEEPFELKIRETIVDIIQQEGILLEQKLIIAYEMLIDILDDEEFSEKSISIILDNYKSKKRLEEYVKAFKKADLDREESMEEVNNLFIDMVENYKHVSSLKPLLKDISILTENMDTNIASRRWRIYKKSFEQYSDLSENCIVYKVISNCISDDIEEMTIALQLIILEYVLCRYAVFLKSEEGNISVTDVKNYIMAFSRIIGNNADAMIEFIKDSFEGEILEVGYLCFISLF